MAVAADFGFVVAGEAEALRRSLRGWLNRAVRDNEGRLILWLPVALAAGIGLYFALPAEPSLLGIGGLLLLAAGCLYRALRRDRAPLPWLTLLIIAGFLTAKIHVSIFTGPGLSAATEAVQIRGHVEEIVRGPKGKAKIVVRLESVSGVDAEERPKRARVTAPLQKNLRVGDFIEGDVRLFPLLTPVMPGGYDFARAQWLGGIGASGDTRSEFRIVGGRKPPLWLALRGKIETLRNVMAERIRSAVPGELGLLAVALITGERASLPEEMKRSLQASGLAHIVSISGLHMSLVAGGFFWALRALLALSEDLALNGRIKEWSAGAALVAGAIYLALSGYEVPTQRSYIMVAIMLGAVIAGRPALSLRNVAIAALLVLVLDPTAVLEPGLQMSFLAVTGLLSFFEIWRGVEERRAKRHLRRGWAVLILRRGLAGLLALAATSIIAGVCTGPPAAYHFNRIAPYGLIGNLLAVPIVSAVVMPMALLGTLLMPIGLESGSLGIMGLGLKAVMSISDWTASLPGAQVTVPRHGSLSAIAMAGGMLWICLIAGAARWCGAAVVVMGLAIGSTVPQPDILIDRAARNVAIRNGAGELVLAHPRRSRFAGERWLLADGDASSTAASAARQGFRCAGFLCAAVVKNKQVVFAAKEAEGHLKCPEADVLIAAFPLRGACGDIALRIDRFDVWRAGSHALYIEGSAIRVETALGARGRRPWVTAPRPRNRPAPKPFAATQ